MSGDDDGAAEEGTERSPPDGLRDRLRRRRRRIATDQDHHVDKPVPAGARNCDCGGVLVVGAPETFGVIMHAPKRVEFFVCSSCGKVHSRGGAS